jgi:conjugal transfer/entry exclusion protein
MPDESIEALKAKIAQLTDQLNLYKPLVGDLAALPGMPMVLQNLQNQLEILKAAKERHSVRFAKYEDMHADLNKLIDTQGEILRRLTSVEGDVKICNAIYAEQRNITERLINVENTVKNHENSLKTITDFIEKSRDKGMDILVQVLIKVIPWMIAAAATGIAAMKLMGH